MQSNTAEAPRYHVNDQGEPGRCSAKIQCRFADSPHFASETEARAGFEAMMNPPKDLGITDLPGKLGEAKIPEGTIRVFHYTPETAASSIAEAGLLESYARGDGGMGQGNEPSAGVWASTGRPATASDGPSPHQAIIEFWITPDQISGRAESPRSYEDALEWGNGYHHLILNGDVPKNQLAAVHLPWHAHARYMESNYKDPVSEFAGDYEGFPDEYKKAYDYLKSKKSESLRKS